MWVGWRERIAALTKRAAFMRGVLTVLVLAALVGPTLPASQSVQAQAEATPTSSVTPVALSTPSCMSSGLGLAGDFNLFVRGDLTLMNSDAEGRVAAGGNVTLASYQVGGGLGNSNGSRDDLIGGGNVDFQNGQVANGNLVYGGSLIPPGPSIPNGTAGQGMPIDFAGEFASLQSTSAALAAVAPNGTTTVQYGAITLVGTDPTVNVFRVAGSDMSNANGLTIDVPQGSTAIVNVDSSTVTMQNFAINLMGTDPEHVLTNFSQATQVAVSSFFFLFAVGDLWHRRGGNLARPECSRSVQ